MQETIEEITETMSDRLMFQHPDSYEKVKAALEGLLNGDPNQEAIIDFMVFMFPSDLEG